MAARDDAAPTFQTVLYERKGPIGHVTLNRPEKLDADSDQLVEDLNNALFESDADPDAEPISGQHDPPTTGIPYGEAEHTSQDIHTAHPMVLVQVDDDFDIRIRPETMPGSLQVPAQFLIAVSRRRHARLTMRRAM